MQDYSTTVATLIRHPHTTTVYELYDTTSTILYVGKTKHPRHRIQAHHRKSWGDLIAFVQLTPLTSRYKALILERRLIAELSPRYNILLRDTKNDPR